MEWVNQIDAAIRDVIAWAATLNPWLCVLLALVLLSLETSIFIGLLVPGEATLLLTVAVLGVRWAPALFAAAVVGNVIGQSGGCWLGRLIGPGLRNTWAGRKIGAHRWQAAEAVVQDTGGRAMITTRFVAVVHAVVPAVVGTLRLPFRRFLGLSAFGAVLWAGAQTAVAVALGEAARAVGYGWTVLALTCAGGVAAGVVVIRSTRRQSARRAAELVDVEPGRGAVRGAGGHEVR
ncbi:DedA family protein [Saccharopolyspora spinosa]|uniref:Membrane protein DedA with SNARE-associated domain n=1 Tax=Saccharopolyspora spinosa TaxID=60894 RepID=A0A2N3XQ78_SACSN|nr:VTT domain-containing protein [Saccharopolyspora spinosa]PKW12782.1 membrane protein DedA with SNARE-associated domain [Saccharopolyspora spinosa]